ncbi:hypothetical protein NE686_17960 [Tissierella carlieri]|uniref:Phage protein n=1 Tax=Tissierella carlieri TaxID=689904 RepID=A0ABT1SEW0_9FIRM|nr:hypothetical protein [Tissierella carlieri]MCQ4924991.1 hypothetical protein [Tissierella carlieri]
MNTMPVKIKNKLRQLRKVHEKASVLVDEVEEMFMEYGIATEYLRALGSYGSYQTEALTFIETCEGDIEDNIQEIEEVFLHYVDKDKSRRE